MASQQQGSAVTKLLRLTEQWPDWFSIELTFALLKMARHDHPFDFEASHAGAVAAKTWFREWLSSADRDPDMMVTIHDMVKQRFLEALIMKRDHRGNYTDMSDAEAERSMELCSDLRLMCMTHGGVGKMDIQPHWIRAADSVFGVPLTHVQAQAWLPDDGPDAMPVLVIRQCIETGVVYLLVNKDREPLASELVESMWVHGYTMLSEPVITYSGFSVDVMDFIHRNVPAGALAPPQPSTSSDFGAGAYGESPP